MGYSDPPPNANNSRNTNSPISNQGQSLGYSGPPPNANNSSQKSQPLSAQNQSYRNTWYGQQVYQDTVIAFYFSLLYIYFVTCLMCTIKIVLHHVQVWFLSLDQ